MGLQLLDNEENILRLYAKKQLSSSMGRFENVFGMLKRLLKCEGGMN